jgi:hypothetical protein
VSVLAPAPDFDAEDGFLHALLGVLAADAAVRRLAPSTAPPARESRAAVDDAADPVLDAILGIVRLTSLASRLTASWAAAPGNVASVPELASTSSSIEGLLR